MSGPGLPVCAGCGARLIPTYAAFGGVPEYGWSDDNRVDYDTAATGCDETDLGFHHPTAEALAGTDDPRCPVCAGSLDVTASGAVCCRVHGSEHFRVEPAGVPA